MWKLQQNVRIGIVGDALSTYGYTARSTGLLVGQITEKKFRVFRRRGREVAISAGENGRQMDHWTQFDTLYPPTDAELGYLLTQLTSWPKKNCQKFGRGRIFFGHRRRSGCQRWQLPRWRRLRASPPRHLRAMLRMPCHALKSRAHPAPRRCLLVVRPRRNGCASPKPTALGKGQRAARGTQNCLLSGRKARAGVHGRRTEGLKGVRTIDNRLSRYHDFYRRRPRGDAPPPPKLF